MGLPLFVVPDETDTVAKVVDNDAARSRSSIRRQRTMRRPTQRVRPEERMRDAEGAFVDVLNPSENRERDIHATRARIAERRRLLFGTDWAVVPGPRAGDDIPTMIVSPLPRSPTPPVTTSDPPQMPPVPESGDFRSRRDSHNIPASYSRRGRNAVERHRHLRWGQRPSPPARNLSSEQTPSAHSPPLPSLTPDFSPARRYTLDDPWSRETESANRTFAESTGTESNLRSAINPTSARAHPLRDVSSMSSPTSQNSTIRDLPALSYVGRSSITDFESRQRTMRLARLDGLGDRDRSLSPDGDGAWETLLTTLTPDPHPPSAGSSFASTTATASTSSNPGLSGTSSATSRTTPDSTDAMRPTVDNACDIFVDDSSDDVSDTEEEEEDDDECEAFIELRDHQDEGRYHSYAEAVEARAEIALRRRGGMEDNLGGLQRIVRRLATREDIPDEWWAEVGLSRIIPRDTMA